MPESFKQEYHQGKLHITSLVLDEPEFVALCKEFLDLFPELDDNAVQRCINNKHVPMMARGTKTEKFFTRYGINTDRMCVSHQESLSESDRFQLFGWSRNSKQHLKALGGSINFLGLSCYNVP